MTLGGERCKPFDSLVWDVLRKSKTFRSPLWVLDWCSSKSVAPACATRTYTSWKTTWASRRPSHLVMKTRDGSPRSGGVLPVSKEGDPVAVYGPWGCGRCHACQLSSENYCENWAEINGFGGGLGLDGGMAEYMLVPSARLLVPLGELSPAKAAPLSDAALTPYHAIKRALPHLHAGTTVVVIGVGGLGHMAIQLLRVLTPVRIVAADIDDTKLAHAKALGADAIVNNRNTEEAAARIQQMTGPRGAGLVLDCVGVQPTMDLGARLLGRNSVWTIVGLGGGHHDFHHGSTPYGTSMSIPYWGSRTELMEVIAMARDGRIHAETTEFPLEQAVEVYKMLKDGQIRGRAVLIPDGALHKTSPI